MIIMSHISISQLLPRETSTYLTAYRSIRLAERNCAFPLGINTNAWLIEVCRFIVGFSGHIVLKYPTTLYSQDTMKGLRG